MDKLSAMICKKMENDKVFRKFISLLAIPLSPIISFLFSLKYFSSLYGGCCFVLLGVFLNTNLAFLQRDDITRMVDVYKQMSVYGANVFVSTDMYFTSLCLLLAQWKVSLYGALCVWSVIYYIGVWLVMRELVKGYVKSYVAILLVVIGFFAIDPGWFSAVRWSTAAFWALFFFLKAKDENWKSWKFYLPLICILVHTSFIFPLLFFYISKFYGGSIKQWMPLAITTLPLPIILNGTYFSGFLRFILPSSILANFGFYLSESRIQSMEALYHYGKFLYLPLLLLLVYMLYLQYKVLEEEEGANIDASLLKMALVFLVAYNFSFISWDLQIRFRTFTVLVMTIAVARYFYVYNDAKINRLFVPLLFAFLLYNYDFIVNTFHTRFSINDIFSLTYEAIESCQTRLAHIRSIYL